MMTIESLVQKAKDLGKRSFVHRLHHSELVELRKHYWIHGFDLEDFLKRCEDLGLYPEAVMRELLDSKRGVSDIRPLHPTLLRKFPDNADPVSFDFSEIPYEEMPKVPRRSIVGNHFKHEGLVRWNGMISRCIRPKDFNFDNYGGRGVKVCDAWHYLNPHGLKNYCDWFDLQMAEITSTNAKEYDVDRRDNDGHYSPDNCRLVLRRVNAQNTRLTKLTVEKVKELRDQTRSLDLKDRGKFVAAQSRILGMAYQTLIVALRGPSWSNVDEISPPVQIGGWTARTP